MDHALQPADDKINLYKICNTCKQTMDTYSRYKNCLLCRARDKAKRERYLLKKKALQQQQFQQQHMIGQTTNTDLNRKYDATSASSTKVGQENAISTSSSSSHRDENRKFLSAGVKRMAQKSLYELEGEERVVALKMAKKSLSEIVKRQCKESLLPTTNLKSVSVLRFVTSFIY